MNDEKNPKQCGATLCCKATAELQIQVEKEKTAEDKSLAELLDNLDAKKCGQDSDANKDTEE